MNTLFPSPVPATIFRSHLCVSTSRSSLHYCLPLAIYTCTLDRSSTQARVAARGSNKYDGKLRNCLVSILVCTVSSLSAHEEELAPSGHSGAF